MATKTYIYLRFFLAIFFLFCLVILAACSGNQIATPLSTNTQVPASITPTRTEVPTGATPTPQPFPDLKEWDLLIISDSTNWGVGEYYAELIEADMNVKVNLHDCWVGAMSIGSALQALQNGKSLYPELGTIHCQSPWTAHAWSDLIKEAEVMVLFGHPEDSPPSDGSWNVPDVFFACIRRGYEGKNTKPGFETYKENMLKSCAPETFSTYKANIGAFIEEIGKIREGRPLVLRMTDSYIPIHSIWNRYGMDEVCTLCYGHFTEAIRQVAEEYKIPVASTMIGLNGKDYQSDPREAGYIGPDGEHLSAKGAQFVATLLQQTGYAYAGK